MVKTGKTKPAIFSYEERVFAHRRQVPSRPSRVCRRHCAFQAISFTSGVSCRAPIHQNVN